MKKSLWRTARHLRPSSKVHPMHWEYLYIREVKKMSNRSPEYDNKLLLRWRSWLDSRYILRHVQNAIWSNVLKTLADQKCRKGLTFLICQRIQDHRIERHATYFPLFKFFMISTLLLLRDESTRCCFSSVIPAAWDTTISPFAEEEDDCEKHAGNDLESLPSPLIRMGGSLMIYICRHSTRKDITNGRTKNFLEWRSDFMIKPTACWI